MNRGAWQGTVHGITKESDTTQQLNTNINMTNIIIANIHRAFSQVLFNCIILFHEIYSTIPFSLTDRKLTHLVLFFYPVSSGRLISTILLPTLNQERLKTVLCYAVLCLVTQSCLTLCNPTSILCPWGFSRQEYWSGLPCPPPGDLPNPEIKPYATRSHNFCIALFFNSSQSSEKIC